MLGSINYEATTAEDPNLQTETVAPGIVRKFYVLMVQAVSSGGIALPSVSVPVKVYVNNLNEAPTALTFADGTNAATITGAVANGTVVGTLLSSDPDGDTQLVYSFDSTGNAGSSGSGNAGRPVQDRGRQAEIRQGTHGDGGRILYRHSQGHRQKRRSGVDLVL